MGQDYHLMATDEQVTELHVQNEAGQSLQKAINEEDKLVWYYKDSTFCSTSHGPLSVKNLHNLWLNDTIQDTTKVHSFVTCKPVQINKIWQRHISDKTVTIRVDTFCVGDEVQFKSWLSSPSPYDNWSFISKY